MKWYWKVYLLLLLLLGYGQMLRKILSDTGGFSSRYGAAIVVTIIIFVLMAKLRRVALGKLWMWKTLFVALAIGCAVMALFSVYLGIAGVFLPAGLLIAGAVLLLPALRELFLYSYRSPSIWAVTESK